MIYRHRCRDCGRFISDDEVILTGYADRAGFYCAAHAFPTDEKTSPAGVLSPAGEPDERKA